MSVRICYNGELARGAQSQGAARFGVCVLIGTTELLALIAGDLFNEVDDPSAQLGVLDVRKGLRQRQAIGARQKIRDVVGDRSF